MNRTLLALLALLVLPGMPARAASTDLGPLLSNQIARCWNPPAGARGTVIVRFELSEKGEVVGTPVVSGLANAGVARAAVHAVQFCQPYRMPRERFSDWQHPVVRLSAP
jgi:TonB family protein